MSVALTLPYSARKTRSTVERTSTSSFTLFVLAQLPDGTDLHRATVLEVGHLTGQLDRFVQVFRLDEIEHTQPLLGFGERTVGQQAAAAVETQRGRGRRGTQTLSAAQLV